MKESAMRERKHGSTAASSSFIDRFRSLFGTSADAALIIDQSGRCVEANSTAAALLGRDRRELCQLGLRDLIAQGSESSDGEWARRLREGRWRGRVSVWRKDGSSLPVDAWAMGAPDASCGVSVLLLRPVIVGRSGDEELQAARVTARNANIALRESEERFRGAFAAASIGMALVAHDGRYLQVNRSLCGILGYAEDELLRRTFQDITYPDDRDLDQELRRQLLNGEIATYQIEKRYVRKDGNVIWGRLTMSLVRDHTDEPLYFVAQVQDVTQYKVAGAALREAEARYRSLVEHIPAAVYVDAADELGASFYISPRIESLLGYTPEEWLATPEFWVQRLHPDDRERVVEAFRRASESGETIHI
jgi:PAS domain S-box-containing protein